MICRCSSEPFRKRTFILQPLRDRNGVGCTGMCFAECLTEKPPTYRRWTTWHGGPQALLRRRGSAAGPFLTEPIFGRGYRCPRRFQSCFKVKKKNAPFLVCFCCFLESKRKRAFIFVFSELITDSKDTPVRWSTAVQTLSAPWEAQLAQGKSDTTAWTTVNVPFFQDLEDLCAYAHRSPEYYKYTPVDDVQSYE